METVLKGTDTTVTIGPDHPTVLIGERINPTGRKKLAAELEAGNIEVVRREAATQVEAGADVIDVNVGAVEVNQVEVLPLAVQMVQEVVNVPISIDTADPAALEAALKVCRGRPLVNSVTGEEKSLGPVLPLVAEYKAAVIGLCMGGEGIPGDAQGRLAVATKIVERAESLGIPREDILIDCLSMTVGADSNAGLITLDAIRLVREELGVNMTMGASNVSFGLPDRETINLAFLPMIIREGVNAPIVNAARCKDIVLATDALLGRDDYAMRYIKNYRQKQKAKG
jgi:5-methyltetrahydrofolate--homocysteine methyltransferase